MAYKHYILTRFNSGLYGEFNKMRKTISPDAWMEHRLPLFEKFTLPSIRNQSCQNFTWLLLVDRRTPKRFIQKIEGYNYSNIEICYANINIYASNIGDPQVWGIGIHKHNDFNIITTRIDNDDSFHVDYVKEIQHKYKVESTNGAKPFVISFPLGCILDLRDNKVIIYKYPINNCPSLVASCNEQNFNTVFCYYHTKLVTKYKTFFIQKYKPSWMMVIHSQNLSIKKSLKRLQCSKKINIPDSVLSNFGIYETRNMKITV